MYSKKIFGFLRIGAGTLSLELLPRVFRSCRLRLWRWRSEFCFLWFHMAKAVYLRYAAKKLVSIFLPKDFVSKFAK